jgi:SOS response regulatory protein OraA/RecX
LATGETELDRALAVLRLRFPTAPRDRRERDRAISVLLRKGYDSDVALDALTAHARAN